jgi:hypothetical protein
MGCNSLGCNDGGDEKSFVDIYATADGVNDFQNYCLLLKKIVWRRQ